MERSKFNQLVEEQLERCKSVLVQKGEEYAPSDEPDRLEHFKKVAVLLGKSQNYAIFTMLVKHLVSISDMCTTEDTYSIERWEEKITDAINYLCILRASLEETKDE